MYMPTYVEYGLTIGLAPPTGARITAMRRKLTCLLLLALSACSSNEAQLDKEIPDGKDSKRTDTSFSVDTPEAELFVKGKDFYRSGLYSVAEESFEALRNGYPLGPYAEFAAIKIADAHFEEAEYGEAAQAYEDFIKDRPASAALPYVLLRAGRSYQLSSRGVGRDSQPLEKASAHYQRLLSEFPNSVYASAAVQYRVDTISMLKASEQRVADYYAKRGYDEAARARLQHIEANVEPQLIQAKAVEPPKVVLAVRDLSSGAPTLVAMARMNSAATEAQGDFPPAGAQNWVQAVECQDGFVMLQLAHDLAARDGLKEGEAISAKDGVAKVQLSGVVAEQKTLSCFGNDDVTISKTGEVAVVTQSAVRAMTLANPARVVISLAGVPPTAG